MKQFILVISFLSVFISYCQVTVTHPSYYYVSKWSLEELQDLPIGSKILFQQNCTTKLPANVPTGIVFFENVFHMEERFSMAVEFKDTVVTSVTYYLKSKQKDLLKAIGYSDIKGKGSVNKGQWTYTMTNETFHTTIVADKKRIVVIQSKSKNQ